MSDNYTRKFSQAFNSPTPDALPFKLCIPLHGVIIGFEWAIADSFFAFNNRVFFAVMVSIFILHSMFLCVARTKYCKSHNLKIYPGKSILHALGILAYILVALFIMECFFLG